MTTRGASALAVAALALSGCGGGDEASGEGCGPAGSGNTVAVCMKDIEFVPMEIKVPAGGKVVWTNADRVPHTVTKEAGPGPEFDSGTVNGGATYEQGFPTAGRIDYVCTIHPTQRGTLVVE